jgi:hypothetical protein
MPAMTARLTLATMSAGSPAGADSENHTVPATSGYPSSAKVGIAGKSAMRALPVSASPVSVPALSMAAVDDTVWAENAM